MAQQSFQACKGREGISQRASSVGVFDGKTSFREEDERDVSANASTSSAHAYAAAAHRAA